MALNSTHRDIFSKSRVWMFTVKSVLEAEFGVLYLELTLRSLDAIFLFYLILFLKKHNFLLFHYGVAAETSDELHIK